MGFVGSDDKVIPPDDVARVDAELTRVGVEHTFHTYDGAGHSFMNDTLPDRFREQAAKDAWQKLVAFLNETLSLAAAPR